jgi:hypothetical protein
VSEPVEPAELATDRAPGKVNAVEAAAAAVRKPAGCAGRLVPA